MNRLVLTSEPPRPSPGFETEFILELKALVRTLPEGVAQLTVDRVPGHPEWPEPYFEITPKNPKAVSVKGSGVATDLELTVGHSWREFCGFAKGGTIVPGADWREDLRWIWQAVVAGQLIERLTLDAKGEVLSWDSRLALNGREVVFRNGRRRGLFGRRGRVETLTYEPYIH
jgi:hypothetical protein